MGIPLYIHSSWFLVLALVTYTYEAGWGTFWGSWSWPISLGTALAGFACILIHELAHSWVAQGQGVHVRSITLFCFGGQALMEAEAPTWWGALGVAVAGPVMSLGLWGVGQSLSQYLPPGSIPRTVAETLAAVNLVLCLFNLLPGLPLDGGNVLKALVWAWSGSHMLGVRFAAYCGLGTSLVVMGLGFWTARDSWMGYWIIGVGAFIGWLAARYARYARTRI
ncbi:site-2 protease family protein [Anthocerotibacter panamensis]|uniref:site-2 protease family protein n=1 Tax=Anthocerotibacter panamensis TaxID=2857077 RepID=UPI001C406809|nr:site-2 protease family protein [Anthocerotibacter panamensis]